ncbi:MAG TPA: DUF389 domain-containing protein [Solirubrobacterales bacterium]|jgi:uncharacterized hydrophobic protein (TIGR00271 family)|nr:DUF389 domain-containing protein [Solirubrobacterales bacterium]
MVHLRIVLPSYQAEHALDLLQNTPSVSNLIYLERAARKPEGDVILCDVAREDASVIVSDLKELHVDVEGSIALEHIDSQISVAAERAEEAAEGAVGDAVVWEEVESRTSEQVELSASFIAFMVLACLIASVGIFLDSPILIIGAMVVGPEFGPIAGLCVAIVQKRREVAKRSLIALAVGFPVGITAAFLFSLFVRAVDLTPEDFVSTVHPLTDFIAHPDWFSFIVASFAGTAGMLSLTNAKSGALVGVLISVTTIPAAANIGVAAAFAEWGEWRGAMAQLAVNLGAIFLAGLLTLYVQRRLYVRRRRAHLDDQARELAGLPLGRSRHTRAPASKTTTSG